MSLGKILIQKGIDKYTRGINTRKEKIDKVNAKGYTLPEEITKDDVAKMVIDWKAEITELENSRTELKADLKKL